MQIEEYAARFSEEPGYLDFGRVGPLGRTVQEEMAGQAALLAAGRFGSLETLFAQDARAREAVSAVTGVAPEGIATPASTSDALMHITFGLRGTVAACRDDFPTIPFAVQRAAEAGRPVVPFWLENENGRLTPSALREQLTEDVDAVIVSLVDFASGAVIDLEGVRDVIGDRLLIVDANQGFGVVDAPYELADAVVAACAKWPRAGWGTGVLALGPRALETVEPIWSGWPATDAGPMPIGEVPPPSRTAAAFRASWADAMAQGRMAAALEEIAEVGVGAIAERIADVVTRLIDLADEFAVPVVSPRAIGERAGIVVLEPEPERLAALSAALHNHGITATIRDGRVRLAAHVSTSEETLAMVRAALLSYSTAVPV